MYGNGYYLYDEHGNKLVDGLYKLWNVAVEHFIQDGADAVETVLKLARQCWKIARLETEAMRKADGHTETMFATSKLDGLVPASHPVRPHSALANDYEPKVNYLGATLL
jgi:adenosylmethionine-8-amino-7-oxononanoate aminotransferase